MRVPLSWLKDYVDITLPVEELAHRLTLAGLEVAALEVIGLPAGDSALASDDHLVWDREKIVVGHIIARWRAAFRDRLWGAVLDVLECAVAATPGGARVVGFACTERGIDVEVELATGEATTP